MSVTHPARGSFGGRFFERLGLQFLAAGDWRWAIKNSALPADVQSIIHDVVQQTGLLRFEKSEIATELIHHFQDGHDHGRTYEELVRDFGAIEVAISLFRSSKLRSRPMSVKAFRGSSMFFGGGVIGYLVLQMFFRSAVPEPTVDFSAKLNEVVTSMPAEEQAWPMYRELWAKHDFVHGQQYDEFWIRETDQDRFSLIRPEDQGWDRAVVKLESLEGLLNVLREGAKRPFLGTPLYLDRRNYSDADIAVLFPNETRADIENETEGKTLVEQFGLIAEPVSPEADKLLSGASIGILLPHIQQFRRAARILRVDTRYALEQGDTARAIENVKTIFGLGKQAGNSPILVCVLVGHAVKVIGFDVIEELTNEHLEAFSDEELLRLQEIAASVEFKKSIDLGFEKSITLDLIQRIYSDDGDGDGRITAVGLEVQHVVSTMQDGLGAANRKGSNWSNNSTVRSIVGPVSLFTAPSRRELEATVEEVFESLQTRICRPMWEDVDFFDEFTSWVNEIDGAEIMTGIEGIALQKMAREVRIARRDAVVLALAIHRYQRAHEKWPTKMAQLSGTWFSATPIDRISGDPLHFTIKDDAPVVYSLGHDGDDDGGVSINSEFAWQDTSGDGDWVLWPANHD